MAEHAALEGREASGCNYGTREQRELLQRSSAGRFGGVSRWPRFSRDSGCEIDTEGKQKWRCNESSQTGARSSSCALARLSRRNLGRL